MGHLGFLISYQGVCVDFSFHYVLMEPVPQPSRQRWKAVNKDSVLGDAAGQAVIQARGTQA